MGGDGHCREEVRAESSICSRLTRAIRQPTSSSPRTRTVRVLLRAGRSGRKCEQQSPLTLESGYLVRTRIKTLRSMPTTSQNPGAFQKRNTASLDQAPIKTYRHLLCRVGNTLFSKPQGKLDGIPAPTARTYEASRLFKLQ